VVLKKIYTIFIGENSIPIMSDKFQNRYRIPSTRLQNRDYGRSAACFITICIQPHIEKFHEISLHGNIINGKLGLSEIGNIANR
jgi:putative transposase